MDVYAMIIFFLLAEVCALFSNWFIVKISKAILVSAVLSVLVFQAGFYFLTGKPVDNYFIVAILSFIVAFFVALVTAIPFRIWRRMGIKES